MDERILIFVQNPEKRQRLVEIFEKTCDEVTASLNSQKINDIIITGRKYCDDEHKIMFLEYCHILPIEDILLADDEDLLFSRPSFYHSISMLTPENIRLYIDERKAIKKLIFG